LISDLQEYTRSRSVSGIPLDRSSCDLEQVCQAAIDAARAAHPARVFGLSTSGCIVSNADAQRLQRALSNLLHNAVQHGAAHGLVKLAAAGDERAVTLSVWNAGPPIPEGALEAIFEPWVRVPGHELDPPDRPAASLGLGLFIAREIVGAHGGTITATSSAESGTRFTIRIPRLQAPAGAATTPATGDSALSSRQAG
jgi:signal transduction histidine kinase